MPGSVASSYGHNRRGINMKNLRDVSAAPPYRSVGGLRPPADWKKESENQMGEATTVRGISSNVRYQSREMEVNFAERTNNAEMTVNDALKSKINKVERLKHTLESSIRATDGEIQELALAKERLEKTLEKKIKSLELNLKRTEIRADRPSRELVNDEVQSKLSMQTRLLTINIDKVKRCMHNADMDMERLNDTKSKLLQDFDDKLRALELDEACLEMEPSADPVDGNLQKRDLTHPHRWMRSTEEGVREAAARHAEAARLRAAINKLLGEAKTAEREVSHALHQSLRDKLGDTQGLRGSLQAQLDDTTEELRKATERKAKLEEAVAEKQPHLALGQQRYLVRKTRPDREMVHDEVETALQQELTDIAHICKQLEAKLSVVGKEMAHLGQQRSVLKSNLKGKDTALEMDKKCLLLDGRADIDAASVISCATSVRSRARSVTLEKIEALEMELEAARSSRVDMEKTVSTLRESIKNGSPAPASLEGIMSS
eukprot:CAMPEP_0182911454 /NCGR_PEP_ID=MMETSP0034_2-20130328/36927_1 /TAXON_ID=156128 /ORGANISM="Nephroselmis pyriformis, Strain CCMP717" /LENGTH=488 /DNA_ID=CAMNT_0025047977 /DNA_START=22 /DNA_END=1488 /DNA_ORIENTATION=-